MSDLIGQVLLARYGVQALVGRGGMAEVYRAWDTWRNYHVAVKVMREDLAEDVEFLRRFRREATALAQLAHENIVRFYSFEREGHLAFIVMDYVQGTTLRRRILEAAGAPLALDQVLPIVQQVCAALHYAHQEGVIHRDIKPGNIMIRPDGRVLVTDFGIAKAADAATATTVMPGTPAYMSPEQCRSEPLDAQTDIYSLGIVVYEMLAGRRPFLGDTDRAGTTSTHEKLRWEQVYADPPPLRQFNPAVTPELEQVVLKALAKEREQRWPSALAFGQALAEVMGRPVHTEAARAPGPAPVPVPERNTQASVAVPGPVPQGEPTGPVWAADAGAASHRPRPSRIPPWVWVAGAATVVVLLAVLALPAIDGAPPTPASTPMLSDETATASAAVARAVAATLTAASPSATQTPDDDSKAQGTTVTPSPSATPTATTTATPVATATTTLTPTSTATATAAATSTNTPIPTATATDTPTTPNRHLLPDQGHRIAFASDRAGDFEVYTMEGDGTDLSRLTYSPGIDVLPSWSPDRTQIVFVSERDANPEIYTMRVDGSTLVRLSNDSANDSFPAWSPDGQWIAFVSDRHGGYDLYVVHPDGSSLRRLTATAEDEFKPAWAADSQRLVFMRRFDFNKDGRIDDTDSPGDDLYLLDVDLGAVSRLTTAPGADTMPAWSPAGQSIAFVSDRFKVGEIFVMEQDGSQQQRLNPVSGYYDWFPDWSPDGTRLIFESNRSGNFDIWLMRADGTDPANLTNLPSDDRDPAWSR